MIRKFIVAAVIAASAVGAVAGPASATHSHQIDTPGACVDRNGRGFGTGQVHLDNSPDPGDTTFHERIHKGTPGSFAFERTNNPVSVVGQLCS